MSEMLTIQDPFTPQDSKKRVMPRFSDNLLQEVNCRTIVALDSTGLDRAML
jgi:hypothetical protein